MGIIHPTAKIDESVRIYGNLEFLDIGANSRIDAFSIITVNGYGVVIGDNVHISAGAYIFGAHGHVHISNGCFLSPRATIYTASDDIGTSGLVGPLCRPEDRCNVWKGSVVLEDCSGVFTGGIVMPDVILGYASVVGANSICNRSLNNGEVMVGMNHRILYVRDWKKILEAYHAHYKSS